MIRSFDDFFWLVPNSLSSKCLLSSETRPNRLRLRERMTGYRLYKVTVWASPLRLTSSRSSSSLYFVYDPEMPTLRPSEPTGSV